MRLLALIFTTAVLGCGIPDDMLMSDLTEQEVETLCGELSGDPREVTCSGDGYEITVEIGGTEAECIEDNSPAYYEGCDVTVGDMRACSDAWSAMSDEEICALSTELPEECQPLLECAFTG